MKDESKDIDLKNLVLGIELGSTRIKCVLINSYGNPIASGISEWENTISDDGYWTYSEELIWEKLQESYSELRSSFSNKYNTKLSYISEIGISGMMHGFMAFDKYGNLLTPYRTWRNNNTKKASEELSQLFEFNIPQRWSVAHLYQAILDHEDFIEDISFITTLSGYITWKLTGQKVLGIGDASGMFPVDSKTNNYDKGMIDNFNRLIHRGDQCLSWNIEDLLPEIKLAGQNVGYIKSDCLTKLDTSNTLSDNIAFAPPEGDAGTGMIATNCIKERTANISVGTSAFSMIVLEDKLKNYYKDVDVVKTPDGKDVAMIHINNCGSEINAWASFFKEFLNLFGVTKTDDEIFRKLFNESKQSNEDVGNLVSYGFHSGENIFDIDKGMPTLLREQDNRFTIPNLIKSILISAFIPLKRGHDVLNDNENIKIDKILAHGGLFRTELIAQEIVSEVLDFPVSTFNTASEGGARGMALLTLYSKNYKDMDLHKFLDDIIFNDVDEVVVDRNQIVKKEVDNYLDNYYKYLGEIREMTNKNRRDYEKI